MGNPKKPVFIESLEHLYHLAQARKSVISHKPRFQGERPLPATFVLGMTGHCILRRFQNGLVVYEPPKKSKWWGKEHCRGCRKTIPADQGWCKKCKGEE